MTLAKTVALRYKEAYGNFTMPRPSYLPPEVRGKDPLIPEGTDLAIWSWEANDAFYAIAFAGKANKPLWNYRFRTEDRRQKQIDETIKDRKAVLKYKDDRKNERKNFEHSYKVGDFLYTSWGYDQTNVNFYEVTDVRGKVIVVRPVSSVIDHESQGAEYVKPSKGSYTGAPMRITPGPNGAKIDGHHGSLWDGKPKYETAFGYGH